ncbi:MAG: hypothetical protein KDA28_11295, partial [Phycisphaerales bacterium]|nr:hypothetical protein [Phycisphaerales bacterium]
DTLIEQDFEGASLHSGSFFDMPNPLNADTAPSWGLEPGMTYRSDDRLRMWAGFLWGDDSNMLHATDHLVASFDDPQAGVGLDVVGYVGTVRFFHGPLVRGSIDLDGQTTFIGWIDEIAGITHVEADGSVVTDNWAWGRTADSCAADLNADTILDIFDVIQFLAFLEAGHPFADWNDDTVVDVFDVLAYLADFESGCS